MNSFELNKIFGAILATLVFVMGVGFIAEEIYAPIENRGSGFELPEPEETAEGEAPEAEQETQIAALLQTASAEAGASVAARCQGCHDLSEANTNRVGPGLYGIVGHVIASHEGFSYSAALSALGEAGEEWDYAHLDAFLTSPQGFAPGTTMAFPGIANAEDRADLIAYLRELSDDPLPLPEAPAEGEAAPAEEAPAEAVEAEAAEDAAPAEEVAPVEEEAPAAEEPADEPAAAEDEAAAAEDAPVAAAAASGYVTEAQVAAGQSAYQQNCASCHGQDIIHSIAGYPNVGLFYSFVSSAMPADNPGGLPQQTYADIIAYLLSENGHPIGTETLPANPAVLSEIDPRALGQ